MEWLESIKTKLTKLRLIDFCVISLPICADCTSCAPGFYGTTTGLNVRISARLCLVTKIRQRILFFLERMHMLAYTLSTDSYISFCLVLRCFLWHCYVYWYATRTYNGLCNANHRHGLQQEALVVFHARKVQDHVSNTYLLLFFVSDTNSLNNICTRTDTMCKRINAVQSQYTWLYMPTYTHVSRSDLTPRQFDFWKLLLRVSAVYFLLVKKKEGYYVHIYIYMYMYIHIHTHIYIYTYHEWYI